MSSSIPTSKENVYPLPAAGYEPTEVDRLDEIHIGMRDQFGGKLCNAPLDNPKRILELGAGSGAWVIEAAETYPEAEVIAVDIAPLPGRNFPSNVKYQQLDLRDELPFIPASFDVVHIRLVLVHMPDGAQVLRRICNLVKPGGWMLIEDMDHTIYSDDLGEGAKQVMDVFNGHLQENGCDPTIGAKLESIVEDTELFDQVNAIKLVGPLTPAPNVDPKLRAMGRISLLGLYGAYVVMSRKVPAMTNEILEMYWKEVSDPNRAYFFDTHIVYARRRMPESDV